MHTPAHGNGINLKKRRLGGEKGYLSSEYWELLLEKGRMCAARNKNEMPLDHLKEES